MRPPGAVPPGDPLSDEDNNHHSFLFDQLGVRVPAVIVSPLIPRNVIDGTIYDHTSLLATVEKLFGLKSLTNRDAAANTFDHLLSLATPRTDAPETLPEPATSGFSCNDDPPSPATPGVDSEALLSAEGNAWQSDSQFLWPSTLRGFLEVALIKAITVTRGRDHQQIRKEYLSVQTHGAARHFMRKVAIVSRKIRLPATFKPHGLIPARMFEQLPRRSWISEPLQNYRRTTPTSRGTQSH